jgi:type I restriction enzyme M protein
VDQETRRRLDRITDVLWAGGVTNPVTYIEQISYLIYLKLLDAEETQRGQARALGVERPALYPGQASRYRWSEWKFKSGAELVRFVRDDVFPYMASLAREEPRIADYFRDATLEIVDPPVTEDYSSPFPFTGTIERVVVEVSGTEPHDVKQEARIALARE